MNTKDKADKALDRLYDGTVDKIRAEQEKRTGADTHRNTSIVIPAEETARKRALAASFEARMAEQDAQEVREREAVNEVSFRADEKQKFLEAGGKEADFNAGWPRLRQQIVEARYLSNRTESASPKSQAQKYLDLHYKRT